MSKEIKILEHVSIHKGITPTISEQLNLVKNVKEINNVLMTISLGIEENEYRRMIDYYKKDAKHKKPN